MTDSLYPVAILIDELKNEDMKLRLNSIRRLSTIAVALGVERTRNELIPFLNESIDDEDEVLIALADELGNFVEYVGGPPHAATLLQPLELLSTVEETLVRDKAVESLRKVARQLSREHLLEHVLPLTKRLAQGDWFTSRISACALVAVAYEALPDATRAEIRALFAQLCRDDTPMVRRAASANLAKLAAAMFEAGEQASLKQDLLPLFSALSTDEQDSVRLMGVENCAAMGKLLSQADNRAVLLPVIRAVAQDKSWRVRYVVAEHICELLPHVGPEVTRDEMLPAFLGMMHDTEAEVRTAAAFKVTAFSELLPAGLAEGLVLPCVRDVCSDKSQHVRAALASVIMGLAPVVGKPVTIEKLLPLFLQLLKDEFPEVRLNLIATLHALNAVVGVDLLAQSLLPAIAELAEDRQWRVRLAIIEYIPLLAAQLGASFFDEKLSVMCLGWLQDCVHTIREAATLNLQKLAQLFGPEWAQKHLLPHVLAPHTHTNYLYRLTALYAATGFAAVVSHDALLTSILPLVLQMTADPVPNVRFNAAKALQQLLPQLDASLIQQQVKPCLLRLAEDSDKDVRYFAGQGLQSC
mmetsp:Transcript_51669/g.124265  ORF Transcript_51669/g.124265 Transcript_51669/m.124265 type:complete len:582 (-) Transcript_51669:224-1969(-)